MNTKSLLTVGAIAVVLIVLGAILRQPVTKVVEQTGVKLSSVTGPSDTFVCKDTNGVNTCNYNTSIATATGTAMFVKIPKNTFLMSAGCKITTATSSYAVSFTVATSSAAINNATTTPLYTLNFLTSATGMVQYMATTSVGVAGSSVLSSPGGVLLHAGEFVVIGQSGNLQADTTIGPRGNCVVTTQDF